MTESSNRNVNNEYALGLCSDLSFGYVNFMSRIGDCYRSVFMSNNSINVFHFHEKI